MYDSTAIFMAKKIKDFCKSKVNCGYCPFAYHPTFIGSNGEQVSKDLSCGLGYPEDEWNIPEEGDNT